MASTLFDKIWDAHLVQSLDDGTQQLYIDRLYCHEVTSPQAFAELRARHLPVFRPESVVCMPDHNLPTVHQEEPPADPVACRQLEELRRNSRDFAVRCHDVMDPASGIIHVAGPEQGYTLPGTTVICGDSHTSTHGAFGCVAFGVGTSEVGMALASACILQPRPKTMRITVNGTLPPGTAAKDLALYLIAQLTTGGATGYFVEYAGEAVRALSMEGRMTLCNLSIEMGARGGMVAPDETTFSYLKKCPHAPKGEKWTQALEFWRTLHSDPGAHFDRETAFDAAAIPPMVTWGTNPGTGIAVDGAVPPADGSAAMARALQYMGFNGGEKMAGKPVQYVFLGACTNGRIEDFRAFAQVVKGRRKAPGVTAWLVPGSWQVRRQIRDEGLEDILTAAGFAVRQPGCSACLAMNEDKIPAGAYAVSTSNRNFEGRQGPGARTVLASPLTAAACAVTGVITDPRTLL